MANAPTLIERLKSLWKGPTTAASAGVGIFSLAGGQNTFIGQAWDFQRIHNTVYSNPSGYRCVEAIVSNFSRPPWMILPDDASWPQTTSEIHEQKNHPLAKILNSPSPGVSATTLQRAMARDLELTGRYFAVKMQGSSGWATRGPTTGLHRLPPQRVIVVGNQDDELLGFVYTDRMGQQKPILPEYLVYLHYPHPERNFDGMAPALVAGLPAETDTASARFNRDLLANDGALPGYLVLKGVTPDQFGKWKEEWERGAMPGKMRFISGESADYVRAAQTNQELTYGELRQESQDDIMRAFGVPRAVAFDVSHETYANAEREQALFMQHNILPKWVLACDDLTLQLGKEFGVRIALNLAGIDELADSRDAVVERGIKLLGMKAMTVNEFRRTQGWPDVPWGDEPQQPVQAMSAVPLLPGAEANPQPPQEPGGSGRKLSPATPSSNGGNGRH